MLQNIINNLREQREILIYGQEDYVFRIKKYLEKLLPKLHVEKISFPLQTEKPDGTMFDLVEKNQSLLNILPKTLVIVAFSVKYHEITRRKLSEFGYLNVVFYDSCLDNDLKKEFFKSYFDEHNIPFQMVNELYGHNREASDRKVEVYMARCVIDKKLNHYPCLSKAIIPIQVGTDLTNKRITEICDNTGENISLRNRRYSEMTAFYWMWKNAKADYLGICHYRRLFVDLDKIVEVLQSTDIDVVLPLPTLCEKSIYEDYLLKHIPDVWRSMLEVLKEFSPSYYKASQKIYQEQCFYASNMCILRKAVLNDLCEWMFPIVMEIERRVGDLEDSYYNRYAGFCTERLMTLYFLYNKHRWKIVHAEKVFIS